MESWCGSFGRAASPETRDRPRTSRGPWLSRCRLCVRRSCRQHSWREVGCRCVGEQASAFTRRRALRETRDTCPSEARATVSRMQTVRNFVGGEWIAPTPSNWHELTNPATGEPLGKVPMCGTTEVADAVRAARDAFPKWRETPVVQRARYLFKFKTLLDDHFHEIARLVTQENGKPIDEARGSLRRGIENVEHACGMPTLMLGDSLEDVASGIDCEYFRQPLGVFAAITPFNFPAMVPLWFYPYAIAAGNTFVLKPSEQVPPSQLRIIELLQQTGLPKGVMNVVHGGKDAVDALLRHPDVVGVSFVGSTPIARY